MDAMFKWVADFELSRRARSLRLLIGGMALCFVAVASSASAIDRVSVRSDEKQVEGDSSGAATNGNGECVAFYSDAANLVPLGPDGDTNGVRDVFLYDRRVPSLRRVSVAADGAQANGPSQTQGFRPSIDANCGCVAYSSDATNLVGGDTNSSSDVFLRLLERGEEVATTIRLSEGASGEGNGASLLPSISGNCATGEFQVAFQSVATNFVGDDNNGVSDIFIWTPTGIRRASLGANGEESDGASISPSMSADGRCVAFASAASNLWPGDTNGKTDIYRACRTEGGDWRVDCRVSVTSTGAEPNDESFQPAITADGSVVAFKSFASNLVDADLNGAADVFVHTCDTGETELASVGVRGNHGNDNSFPPSISGDGRFVAFGSFADNFVPGLSMKGRSQIFVRDRALNTTRLVSVTPGGAAGNGSAPDLPPSVSLDGTVIAFVSTASDLVPGDTNEAMDVFVAQNLVAPTPTPTNTMSPTPSITDTPTVTATPTATVSCFVDQDCPVNNICLDGICGVVPCSRDLDCPGGRICLGGVCQPLPITPSPLPTCVTDDDCPEPDRCRAMVCVPPRGCDDSNPEIDRVLCRGDRETCVGTTCECGGDCNLDGFVFGNEISVMVGILGGEPLSNCPAADIVLPPDGQVFGNEITLAVLNLGYGCPGEGLPLDVGGDRTNEIRTLDIGSATAVRGGKVTVPIGLSGGGDVATAQLDLLFDNTTLSITDPSAACAIDQRLAGTHILRSFLPQRPATPPGVTRLRLLVADLIVPVDTFGEGLLLSCTFDVNPDVTLPKEVVLAGERLNIGDAVGAIFGAASTPGVVTVENCLANEQCPDEEQCLDGACRQTCTENEDCPAQHVCDDGICQPWDCVAPRDCAEYPRRTCVNNICVCTGDCNGDGLVFGNEITQSVRILGGVAPLSECLAADADLDGQVFGNEVSLGVINLGQNCPGVE